MSDDCLTVFCAHWTGDGCACRVFGIEPEEVEHDAGCACQKCERAAGPVDPCDLCFHERGDHGGDGCDLCECTWPL